MADDAENDDQWLYGDQPENIHEEKQSDPPPIEESSQEPPESQAEPPPKPTDDAKPPGVDDEPEKEPGNEKEDEEDGEVRQNGEEEDLDDDSDDDVNVVIGDIKTTPSYTSLNIKRGGLLTTTAPVDKTKQAQQPGKFSIDEFDQAGMINGVPATEYNLDSLEDKPWRKPGADITDYFNYGFNEDTWRAYCERQKR
jgi:pre-mRNA 3'-end-processing factor FIP1